jgi:DNA-binding response OmpR family regulator
MARILLIEDDVDILELITWILNEDGHQVKSSFKVLPLEEIEAFNPNIVLLDEWLQGSAEREVWCQSLKVNLKDTIILMLTLSSNPLDQTILQSGVNGYIEKPFDIDELCLKVHAHLR